MPGTPAAPAKLPNARHALLPGLTGGLIGAALSGIANYAFVGMPGNEAQHLLHQAGSGLVTGALGGFIGLMMHLRKASAAAPDGAGDE